MANALVIADHGVVAPPPTMCPLTSDECSDCTDTLTISGSIIFGGNPFACFGTTGSFSFLASKGDTALQADDCAYGDGSTVYEYPCDEINQTCFYGVEVLNNGECKILWSSSGVTAGTGAGVQGNRVVASCGQDFSDIPPTWFYAASVKTKLYLQPPVGDWLLVGSQQFGTSFTGAASPVICPDAILGTNNGVDPGTGSQWSITIS